MYQSDNLGNVQEFLKEMLEMYHYETTLMKSTTQAIHSDIHAQQLQLQAESRRGLAVHTLGKQTAKRIQKKYIVFFAFFIHAWRVRFTPSLQNVTGLIIPNYFYLFQVVAFAVST